MAPKRPLGNSPPASSEEEDEEEEEIEETQEEEEVEEEEEEDEDEEEEEPVVKQSIAMTQASKPEEESESSTDSNASDVKIKKHAKQIAGDPKIATPELSTPISKKRAAETPKSAAEASSKRSKGPVTAASFQRIWSDEDVIAILEAMIRFKEEKGAEPSPTEMAEFYESIKGLIHIQVSKNQLSDKFRTLRKKYKNNAKRGQDGEDPVFSKPHEHKTFQLSKLIWGDVSSNGAVLESVKKKSNKKSKGPCAKKEEQSYEELLAAKVNSDEFWTAYPSLNKAKELMHPEVSASMGLVRRSKVKEMDEKWHKLQKKVFELSMKKAQLFLDVSQAIGFSQGN